MAGHGQPGMKCPNCKQWFKISHIPSIEAHQAEFSRAYEQWSMDDFLTLRRMYQEEGADMIDIAMTLNRPPGAVVKKIKDMGIRPKQETVTSKVYKSKDGREWSHPVFLFEDSPNHYLELTEWGDGILVDIRFAPDRNGEVERDPDASPTDSPLNVIE